MLICCSAQNLKNGSKEVKIFAIKMSQKNQICGFLPTQNIPCPCIKSEYRLQAATVQVINQPSHDPSLACLQFTGLQQICRANQEGRAHCQDGTWSLACQFSSLFWSCLVFEVTVCPGQQSNAHLLLETPVQYAHTTPRSIFKDFKS